MKLLVDANLAPRVVEAVVAAGFQAIHVRDVGLLHATDQEIFDWAAENGRVIVTADSDFAMLLAFSQARSPSVVQLRGVAELRPAVHGRLLVENLSALEAPLVAGAIVSLSPDRVRIRDLPIER